MNIEEIMKPYFDKKEEFSRRQQEIEEKYNQENRVYKEENEAYEAEMRVIKLRLERLRGNKEQEIEEYVKNAVSDRPDFYAGYGAMVRKDLEQSYLTREKELENQIMELNAKINNNYLRIAENNKKMLDEKAEINKFHKVDLKQLADIKDGLRSKLLSAKKDLEINLAQTKLDLDTINLKMATFKYIYDDNHNAINGGELKKLFDQSNSLIETKYNLEKQLKQLSEYLKLSELTNEESSVLLSGLNPVEKIEYERRKLGAYVVEQPVIDEQPIIEETPVVEELPASEDIEELEEPELVEEPEQKLEDNQIVFENATEFIGTIYEDVLNCAKKLRSVELDGSYLKAQNPSDGEYQVIGDMHEIGFPNGIYLNRKDIDKALANYVKENKGRTFKIKGIEKTFEVNNKTLKEVKKQLRECSTIKLVRERKIGTFDLRRIFGKKRAEEYYKLAQVQPEEIKMPSGAYVNLEEFTKNLKHLFAEKSPTWFEKLTSKFKKNESLAEEAQLDYEDVEEIEVLEEPMQKIK